MDAIALYQSKLSTPNQAVAAIPGGPPVYGHGMPNRRLCLQALADRAAAGEVDDLGSTTSSPRGLPATRCCGTN